MNYLRSVVFLLVMLVVTPPYALLMIFCFPLPHRLRRYSAVPWVYFTIWLIKHLLGIDYRVLGREHIPDEPVVILAKHQSAWETVVLQQIFPLALFVWKKELRWQIPFFGWALAVIPMIAIDRQAGKHALRDLVRQGKLRLSQGYPIVIFPEGTRTEPGQHRTFKTGGAHLAVKAGAKVLPVALNSGELWGRNAFFKTPGTITVSVGPAISTAGLRTAEVNARAEAWIEAEMARISPHLYRHEIAQDTQATESAARSVG
ncbi:Phospholipid and glycerol acyltransferase [Sterolibacterium denitrificans]|uniref:Phospholipid and glycerol acyltransferase n=1 Tax=Sterolibacterium denitrificans TaxID=157592 RepID=A0A7Z7MV83_9PROT|nr:lysophospholipid acyltransferase family protein [Sterolibacterium denitrificans]SMB26398.1 Phospholipid and glycerol acyltransferase [Sterolibacterium denitrificans]